MNDSSYEKEVSVMKEKYTAAEMEIVEFEAEDVIRTSSVPTNNLFNDLEDDVF